MPRDLGPTDPLRHLGARPGARYPREYPYTLEGPRPRPWRRVALAAAPVLLAATIGTALAVVLVEWASMPW
jgi:hypothetical protein